MALAFAREGADVAITHLEPEREDARLVCEAVEGCARKAMARILDQSDPEACARVVDEVCEELGGLDILVNNGAVQNHCAFETLDLEQWRRTFETNIFGYFYMVKAALPKLGEGASIINTGSITGLEGSGRLVDYAATKGAIHAFSKSLAQALVERGIRVNCVAPGPVWTPLNPAERDAKEVASFGGDQPLGRPAQPEEVAPIYVYFASNADSSYVSGEVFTVLGGQTRAA